MTYPTRDESLLSLNEVSSSFAIWNQKKKLSHNLDRMMRFKKTIAAFFLRKSVSHLIEKVSK
jgi:hypothetical protein